MGTTYETKGYNNREDPSTGTWFHRCQNLKSHSDCISFQNSNTVRAILTATLIKFHALKILELHTFKKAGFYLPDDTAFRGQKT